MFSALGKRFADSKDIELAKIGNGLDYIIQMVFRFYKLYKSDEIEKHRFLPRIKSLYATAKLQKLNPLQLLLEQL